MAKVKIQGHASGTGIITLTAPNTSTDRTVTLPDADVTLGASPVIKCLCLNPLSIIKLYKLH